MTSIENHTFISWSNRNRLHPRWFCKFSLASEGLYDARPSNSADLSCLNSLTAFTCLSTWNDNGGRCLGINKKERFVRARGGYFGSFLNEPLFWFPGTKEFVNLVRSCKISEESW